MKILCATLGGLLGLALAVGLSLPSPWPHRTAVVAVGIALTVIGVFIGHLTWDIYTDIAKEEDKP